MEKMENVSETNLKIYVLDLVMNMAFKDAFVRSMIDILFIMYNRISKNGER